MAIDKGKVIERLKAMSPEDRALFRDAVQEAEPEAMLSIEEVSTLREMLAGKKGKKKGGILDDLSALLD